MLLPLAAQVLRISYITTLVILFIFTLSGPTISSPRKRPYSAVDNSQSTTSLGAAPPPAPPVNVKPSPDAPSSGSSPNKRPKTTHDSPRSSNKPGHLSIPPVDIKQITAAAQSSVAAIGAPTSSNVPAAPSAEEYKALMQRVHQHGQASSGAPSAPTNTTSGSPETSKSAASAKGKPVPSNISHQRQLSHGQGRNSSPANAPQNQNQSTPSVKSQSTGTSSVNAPAPLPSAIPIANSNPALNLSPAQILITAGQIQKAAQNQVLAQATAQQMHLRRPGIAPHAGAVQMQALAQQAAVTRAGQAQHRPPSGLGQTQPKTQAPTATNPSPSRSPGTGLAPPRPAQTQTHSSPLQPPPPQSQPQAQTQGLYPQATPPTPIQQAQAQTIAALARAAQGGNAMAIYNNPQLLQTLQQRGFTPDQIKQILIRLMSQRALPRNVQNVDGRRRWVGAIKWPLLDPQTKQLRTIEAHIHAIPLDEQVQV